MVREQPAVKSKESWIPAEVRMRMLKREMDVAEVNQKERERYEMQLDQQRKQQRGSAMNVSRRLASLPVVSGSCPQLLRSAADSDRLLVGWLVGWLVGLPREGDEHGRRNMRRPVGRAAGSQAGQSTVRPTDGRPYTCTRRNHAVATRHRLNDGRS